MTSSRVSTNLQVIFVALRDSQRLVTPENEHHLYAVWLAILVGNPKPAVCVDRG